MIEVEDGPLGIELKKLLEEEPESVFTCEIPYYCDTAHRIVVYQVCTDDSENITGFRFKVRRLYHESGMGDTWVSKWVITNASVITCVEVMLTQLFGFQSGFRLIEWSNILPYIRIAELIASIHFYTDFIPKSSDESALVQLLGKVGLGDIKDRNDLDSRIQRTRTLTPKLTLGDYLDKLEKEEIDA